MCSMLLFSLPSLERVWTWCVVCVLTARTGHSLFSCWPNGGLVWLWVFFISTVTAMHPVRCITEIDTDTHTHTRTHPAYWWTLVSCDSIDITELGYWWRLSLCDSCPPGLDSTLMLLLFTSMLNGKRTGRKKKTCFVGIIRTHTMQLKSSSYSAVHDSFLYSSLL